MWKKCRVGEFKKTWVDLRLVRVDVESDATQLLDDEHIPECGPLVTTYVSVFERTDHCRLIDDLSSGSIHDERALLELPDHLLIDHTFCILSERNVHAKDIRLREHLIELVRCEVLAPVGSERVLAASCFYNPSSLRLPSILGSCSLDTIEGPFLTVSPLSP